jgi:hypothetical protein
MVCSVLEEGSPELADILDRVPGEVGMKSGLSAGGTGVKRAHGLHEWGGLEIIKDVERCCKGDTGGGDATTGLENQLDRGGEVEGVVTAVDAEDDEALENDNHERDELCKEDDIEGDEMEQATQDLSLPFLWGARYLPLSFLRSSTSHSTTLRRESNSSFFLLSWLRDGEAARCSTGNNGPCILARTSLKGTVRDSSYVGRIYGWERGWEGAWGDLTFLVGRGVGVMKGYTNGSSDDIDDDPRNCPRAW